MSTLAWQMLGCGLLVSSMLLALHAGGRMEAGRGGLPWMLLAAIALSFGGGCIAKGGERRGMYLAVKELARQGALQTPHQSTGAVSARQRSVETASQTSIKGQET